MRQSIVLGLGIITILANSLMAEVNVEKYKNQKGMFAVFNTTKGDFVCELYPNKAPKTVDNFVGLAEATKEFTDPQTGAKKKKKYYDGLIFHRVIPQFMIQGGCPLGQGTGGPGYTFEDEVGTGLSFDGPGVLAMANAGPGTNGSQFFITVAATPWLTNKHTIFGRVVEGQDIVNAISNAPRGRNDRPNEDIHINTLVIVRGKN